MNQTESNSNSKDNVTLLIENCHTFISLQSNNGKPTIHVDIHTSNFENYDHIQQFLVEKGAEFFEFPYNEKNMVITDFKMDTKLNLFLQNPKPNNI